MSVQEILLALIRYEICGTLISDEVVDSINSDMLSPLYKLAAKHDVAHIVAKALFSLDKLRDDNISRKYKKVMTIAFLRYERMNGEFEKICEALEKAQIQFIPLKGSVLREYYSEAWMRTSCDIDILIHQKDLASATRFLADNLGYNERKRGSHDISLFSPGGVHLELHYDLIEEGWANSSRKILTDVWNYASVKNGHLYWCELSDAMFYFYHIAHMAKHLQQGGCGIKAFIDLWVLDKIDGVNKTERDDLLDKGELLQFAQTARYLSKVWFGDNPINAVSEKMQNYVIRGGVYGALENRIAVQQQKQGGKIRYAFSKIVIPYDTIKFHYPILQKHRWLTPIMQVRRWFKLVFCGHAKRSMRELSYNKNISKSQADDMKAFLNEIGL